jgi:hypothetical protein
VSGRTADNQLSLFAEPAVSAAFEVRSSRRARRLSIRVFPHGRVEIVVPFRTPAVEVERFVAGHRAWIDRTLAGMADTAAAADLSLPDRVDFRAAGESWLITRRTGPRLRLTTRATSDGGSVTLVAPAHDEAAARLRLRAWVVEQGRRVLLPRLELLAERHGLAYRRAGVGRQKTRWGSCSAAGHIRLNCSLLFLPARLADYVMLHELSHLRVLDHSPRFWRVLDSLVADARALDAEMSRAWSRVPGWLFYGD